MSSRRMDFAVGVVAVKGIDTLYAVGGFDGVNHLDTVEAYTAEQNVWTTQAAKLNAPRSQHALASVHNPIPWPATGKVFGYVSEKLYVIGGINSEQSATYDCGSDGSTTTDIGATMESASWFDGSAQNPPDALSDWDWKSCLATARSDFGVAVSGSVSIAFYA
jgi:hypothetical protein